MFSHHLNIATYISCSEFLGALKNFCLRWKRKLKSTIYGLFLNPNILTVESLNYFISNSELWIGNLRTTLCCVRKIIFVNPYSAKKSPFNAVHCGRRSQKISIVLRMLALMWKRDQSGITLLSSFSDLRDNRHRSWGRVERHLSTPSWILLLNKSLLWRNLLTLNSKKWMTRTGERWRLIEKSGGYASKGPRNDG